MLTLHEYEDAIRAAGRLLITASARAGFDAPVPTCPEWLVRDLLIHQGIIHRWATELAAGRTSLADEPLAEEDVASSVADPILADWLETGLNTLITTLESMAPDSDVPTFLANAPRPREFWTRRQAHETTIQTVIPPVVIAESALTAFCRRVARPGDPRPEALLFGFESEPIRAEQSLHDLAAWAREHGGLASALEASDAVPDERPERVDEDVWAQWRDRFAAHLAAHGHATDTLDLAQPVAADTPELLWDVLRMYLRGEGTDPRERREKAARAREEGAATISAHSHRRCAGCSSVCCAVLRSSRPPVRTRSPASAWAGPRRGAACGRSADASSRRA